LAAWLKRKELEAGEATHAKYTSVVKQFNRSLGSKAKRDIVQVTACDITKFRDQLADTLAPGTVNVALKIIRSAFAQAHRDGLIDANEAERVSTLKKPTRFERRPFSLPELKRILEPADDEWRGMILFGLYTGQRLGDIARLTWHNVDLQHSELRLTTEKTGRIQTLPLASPLRRFIEEKLPAGDRPGAPLFPRIYATAEKHKYIGNLSNQFYGILVSAGLALKKSHKSTGKGRNAKREQNALSFHSLRHTATSLLKRAGVSDAVAMEFIGHDSKSVSRQYTHIDTATLKAAADKLPDVLS
jgi:integrase